MEGMTLWCALLHSGVLVPGGFGVRGTEGKIQAIAWARKQKKPFLGKELERAGKVPRGSL